MEIGKTYMDITMDHFQVNRKAGSIELSVLFTSSTEEVKATMRGIRDLSGIEELLDADKIWIERSKNPYAEFGRFQLGFVNEGCIEIDFDELLLGSQ